MACPLAAVTVRSMHRVCLSLKAALVTPQKLNSAPQSFDAVRAARMGGYGFCFYGPYQHFWYGQLDKFFPTKSLAHFGTKVNFCAPLGLHVSTAQWSTTLQQA